MKRGAKPESVPITNPLHGKFDEMVDAVIGNTPVQKKTLVRDKATVEAWAVPLSDLHKNKDMRLDASHYDQLTAAALKELDSCNCATKSLAEIATVKLPGQFVRIWAKDKEHGVQYVNATDLMSLTGLGALSGEPRYLSRQSEVNFDELIIREGWLLLTCSGTIGRVFYVSNLMDGWVATHDLIRIIPSAEVPVGFLHAYLSSPVAQKQILGHTHGGQIDHVTHHQVGLIRVPLIQKKKMQHIHELTMQALNHRTQAIATLNAISDEMQQLIKA